MYLVVLHSLDLDEGEILIDFACLYLKLSTSN